MSKIKKIFTNVKVIIAIIALILAVIAINPNPWADGLAIRSVAKNSSAAIAGIQSPTSSIPPMSREVISNINNIPVKSLKDYYDFVNTLEPNRTFTIKTNKNLYRLTTKPAYKITLLNETETQLVTEEKFDEILNKTVNITKTITSQKIQKELLGIEDIGLGLYDAPTTNIRKGLDLSGGSRVVMRPVDQNITEQDYEFTIENIKERLNVFGISDVNVRSALDSPINGNKFIIVEIAGVTKEEITSLLANQGKFEAKIGNETVFVGGKDITYVCRSPECSGIDPNRGCGQTSDGEWNCRFRFSIAINPEAAQRQADATKNLEVVIENDENYLSQNIDFFLDDELVDSLKIGSELKGNAQTEISISGSGSGTTSQGAMSDTLKNMKRMQTILITGSLPVKLEIVKSDAVSPTLGDAFIKNALTIGILATIAISLVIFIRYRKLVVSIPMLIVMIGEMIIMIGVAALIGWNLDVSAIAGIIIAIGTGVNDQIVIADETLSKGSKARYSSWKDKLKSAFFIIMTAYLTIVVAMIPLWFAGAGLLKGFALTTIIGVSIGVFITRPAYAKVVEILCAQEE
jgi:preprotein translocase subunit SecD